MGILIESGILNPTAPDDGQGDIKKKFNGENIYTAIQNTGSFDSNYLTYVDFLDCLVRVAFMYPFPEAERAQYAAMDNRLQFLIEKLAEKYGGVVNPFIELMAKREQEMRFQPRIVTDDDIDDDYDVDA